MTMPWSQLSWVNPGWIMLYQYVSMGLNMYDMAEVAGSRFMPNIR